MRPPSPFFVPRILKCPEPVHIVATTNAYWYTWGNPPCRFAGRGRATSQGVALRIFKELFVPRASPRIFVYVDGFNFYYGLYKAHKHGVPPAPAAHKWLDLLKLGQAICHANAIPGTVEHVTYCTSPSLPGHNDQGQATRQEVSLRALRSFPNVHVELGQHTEHPKNVRALGPDGKAHGYPYKAMVREEKGSDVNLAAFLIRDAALDRFDTALVLSNDSDLKMAVRITRADFGKNVIVVSPHFRQTRVARELVQTATKAFRINPALLAGCLLPDEIRDAKGRRIFKPEQWS